MLDTHLPHSVKTHLNPGSLSVYHASSACTGTSGSKFPCSLRGLIGLPHVVLEVKNPPARAGDVRDAGLIPGLRRSSGEGNGNPLQYSCLENSIDRGARRATVHGVSNSQTWPGTVQHMVTAQLRGMKPWTLAFLSLPPSSFSMTWVLPRPPSSMWIGNLPRYQHLCPVDLRVFLIQGHSWKQFSAPRSLCFQSLLLVLELVQTSPLPSILCLGLANCPCCSNLCKPVAQNAQLLIFRF